MKLIVGLGNIGEQYTQTRHNLGFMVVDELAAQWGVHFEQSKKLKSELLVTMYTDETIVLAKPQTFMNLSGSAVAKIKQFYKLSNADIWVVSDDVDLEFGKVRVRIGGSSGGHNGLKDIIESIGEDIVRVRVGVKNASLAKTSTDIFVLQKFSEPEQEKLPAIIDKATQTIVASLDEGVSHQSSSL